VIRIVVRGIPAPQGSKKHVGGGRLVEQSRAVGPWREAVRAQAQLVMQTRPPAAGPLSADVIFYLPRPKTVRTIWPAKRPDLDKLLRAVFDGLTDGQAWGDDGQVVVIRAAKFYATPATPAGCAVTIHSLKENDV
jgi:crossover junction endodeoxyribonuclease RusA